MFDFPFFLKSIALGVGLAMDAFSVSLANGLNEPCMKKRKTLLISGTFAFFQALMPFIGWLLVTTVVQYFQAFEKFIPYIALALLCFIGGKMLYEGIKNDDTAECKAVGFWGLIIQGVATSIDALSTGFTISNYLLIQAIVCALVISVVTFIICVIGVNLGKKFGTKLSGKASILGGSILIFIGLEIFISGVFF